MGRRQASGSATQLLFLRLGLAAALIAPAALILLTSQEDVLKLVLTCVAGIIAAFIGGHFLTILARVPVMPNIHGPWLAEIRQDVIDAPLVAILQNKGVELAPGAAEAGRRGWASTQAAAKAVAALQS